MMQDEWSLAMSKTLQGWREPRPLDEELYGMLRKEIVRCQAAEDRRDALEKALDAGSDRGRRAIRALLMIQGIAEDGSSAKKMDRDMFHEIESAARNTLSLWDSSVVEEERKQRAVGQAKEAE